MTCNEVNKEMPVAPCILLPGILSISQVNISSSLKIYLPYVTSVTAIVPLQTSGLGDFLSATLTKGKYKMVLSGDIRSNQQVADVYAYLCFARIDGMTITMLTESLREIGFSHMGEAVIMTMETEVFDVTGTTTVQLYGGCSSLNANYYYMSQSFIWNIFKLD